MQSMCNHNVAALADYRVDGAEKSLGTIVSWNFSLPLIRPKTLVAIGSPIKNAPQVGYLGVLLHLILP